MRSSVGVPRCLEAPDEGAWSGLSLGAWGNPYWGGWPKFLSLEALRGSSFSSLGALGTPYEPVSSSGTPLCREGCGCLHPLIGGSRVPILTGGCGSALSSLRVLGDPFGGGGTQPPSP